MVKFRQKQLRDIVNAGIPRYEGVKGSIVRLRIKNFVTYRDVELHAGPNINLVLGPNGTGKSTIVCAICLALGGKTKILSRATNVKEYIRHGAKEASVEIEMYNPKGDNYVVKRVITQSSEAATGAKSSWFLQNRPVAEKRVEELMVSLNIQLDNLCQFLPQDRVQEFARMDAVSRLKCTEMAIGSDDLSIKHEELISMNGSIKKLEYSLTNIGENLRTEQQQNQRLQTDVQTFKEREELNEKIRELQGKKLWIAYQNALNEFNTLKESENKLLKSKQEEERLVAPLKKAVDRLEASLAKYKDQAAKLRQSVVSKVNMITKKYTSDREHADIACNELAVEIEANEQTEKERLDRLMLLKQRMKGLESELADCARDATADPVKVQQEVGALNRKKTDINREIVELNLLDEQETAQRNDLARRADNAMGELRRMGDMKVSRMKYLERFFPDVHKTYKYFEIEENRAKLKGKLWDPPILHVFVDDLKYGSVAEKHIRQSDLTAFYCEHKDDVYTISDLVTKELGARVSVIHHVRPHGFKKPQSAFSAEFMRKYHFEKVLIDLIQAPDYYMSYLVPTFKPEYVPMGGAALDQLMGKIMEETDLKAFYSEEYAYFIKTSAYSGQKFSTCTHLNPPRIFTTKINETEQNKIKEVIAECQANVKTLDAGIRNRGADLKRLEEEKGDIDNRIREIKTKADRHSKLETRYEGMKAQARTIEAEKKDLAELERHAKLKSCARRMAQLESIEAGEKQLFNIANEALHQSISKKQLNTLQSKIIIKQNQYEEAKTNIVDLTAQIKAAAAQVKTAAEQSSRHKAEAMEQSKLDGPPDDVRKGKVTDESLDRDLGLAKVQLGFLTDIPVEVIRKYQERCAKINDLEKSKSSREYDLKTLQERLTDTKAQWLTPLSQLIDRINENFARFFSSMQCAGRVYLDPGTDENDFSKYGIKIQVKFRAAEHLTELSGWKQSGGERAITTALYVLALQELTTVPFRVIDEINQGMDAKNEARFFNLLSSLAEGDNTPQYFLLTPKMLPDVDYPDNVKFHVIFSGPYVRLNNFSDSKGIAFTVGPVARNTRTIESSDDEEDLEDEADPEEVDLAD